MWRLIRRLYIIKLVRRLSQNSIESDTFDTDFMESLVRRLYGDGVETDKEILYGKISQEIVSK